MLFYDLLTDWEWTERPLSYGWFHIVSLILMVLACILFVFLLARKHNKKTDNIFVFSIGLVFIVLEVYKQIFYTLYFGYYNWGKFPFQFCSLPMYLAFVAPLIKNEKIQDVIYRFLASFCFLAGFGIMIYPASCFSTSNIVMSIHTMIWHSLIVILGVYLIVSRGYGKKVKELLTPTIMFIFFALVATVTNILSYNLYFGDLSKNIHEVEFMLFYISPYYDMPLEFLTSVRDIVGFPLYVVLYITVVCLGVNIIWLFLKVVRKLLSAKKTLCKNIDTL